MQTIDAWYEVCEGLNEVTDDTEWQGPCPRCGGDDRFHIRVGDKVGENGYPVALWGCRGCAETNADRLSLAHFIFDETTEDFENLSSPDEEAPAPCPGVVDYDYHNADGTLHSRVRRKNLKSGRKTFSSFSVRGGKLVNKAPTGTRPLYGLPALLGSHKPVVVVEGEKCAEALRAVSSKVIVTTWQGGAAWKRADWTPLQGRTVYIVPDADKQGAKYAAGILGLLTRLPGTKLYTFDMGGLAGDVADWIDDAKGNFKAWFAGRVRLWDGPSIGHVFHDVNPDTLRVVLSSLDCHIRFNVRDNLPEFLEDGRWEPMNDMRVDYLRYEVAKHFFLGEKPLLLSREQWEACTNVLMRDRKVDPFREYLDELPAWDGNSRLSSWISDAWVLDGTPKILARWASEHILLSAVTRAVPAGSEGRLHADIDRAGWYR